MPLFEFRCLSCGHVFELLMSFEKSERERQECPECGILRTSEKLPSRTGYPKFVGPHFHCNAYPGVKNNLQDKTVEQGED